MINQDFEEQPTQLVDEQSDATERLCDCLKIASLIAFIIILIMLEPLIYKLSFKLGWFIGDLIFH